MAKVQELKEEVTINIQGHLHDLSKPKVMGILNITPDSFYAGSRIPTAEQAVDRASKMVSEGAWCLDIGGYSSRPGADDISVDQEIARVIEPIKAIREAFPDLPISIDTFRSQVAELAVEAGASLINDISGGQLDSRMIDLVAELRVPFIAMHMRGTPQNMKDKVQYDDLISEMIKYFSELREKAYTRGIADLILDPGFGFAKDRTQNFEILSALEDFRILDCPLLIGVSRKSMIFKTLDISAQDALNGTTVLNTVALLKGANILRVHDVKEAREAIELTQKMVKNK